jgi:Flp pilus assembly protein TadG
MKSKLKSQRGQTLIEFAFIIVVLLIIVMGIIEFSIVMYNKAILTKASREAVREALVFRAAPDPYDPEQFIYSPLTESNIKNKLNNYLQNSLITFGTPFDANATDAVSIVWRNSNGTPVSNLDARKGTIDVLVSFRYGFLTLPNLGGLSSNTLDIHARTIMRVE